ncbi:MAG: ATPase, T2SS/T4P/T4SS family [Planctomycetota bacterium]|nr:ATPase, T2SS/T4P/T4SS family [Planctomycetota bacterium]
MPLASRKLISAVSAILVVTLGCSPFLFAQEWPDYVDSVGGNSGFRRGPGFYLSWWKLLLCIPVFLFWVKAADWVNVDLHRNGETTKLKFDTWNPALSFSFLGGFIILLCIPLFWIGFPVYLLSGVLPYFLYLGQRNRLVPNSERTLLPRQKRKYADAPAAVLEQDKGVPLEFIPGGENSQRNQANLIAVRQNPFFLPIKEFVNDIMKKRAEKVQLEFSKQAVGVSYEIDGLWTKMPVRDRESGDAILNVFKQLSDLNPNDRKGRQEGSFQAASVRKKINIDLVSVGVPTGERVLLKIQEVKKKKTAKILELGMLPDMLERLKPLLKNPGYVLVSSMPGDGMSSSWLGVLDAADLVTRDFAGVCDLSHQDRELENVEFREINKSAGETPLKELKNLALKLPQVYVVPDPCDGETINYLGDQIESENVLCISQVQAKSAVEAVVRILAFKPDRSKFAKNLTGILFHRLFRRLCDKCKQPFTPNAQMLKQLGLPTDARTVFFQQYQPPPPEELVDKKGRPIDPPPPCSVCGGTGYFGRIAVFELLEINDKIRQAVVNKPTVNDLTAAARLTGHRNLQAEAIALLTNGVTSVQEIQRVLKK